MKSAYSQVFTPEKPAATYLLVLSLLAALAYALVTMLPKKQPVNSDQAVPLQEKLSGTTIDEFIRYFPDKTGEYDADTIFLKESDFIGLGEKSISLRTEKHWYWIRIHNPHNEPLKWFISSGISTPPLLRSYWRSDTHPSGRAEHVYDTVIPGQSAYRYPLTLLPLKLEPKETGDLLIEYQSLANFPLQIRPYNQEDLIERSQRLLFTNGFYLGALAVFFLFFLGQFFIRPTRVHFFYCMFVFSIMLIMLQVNGYRTETGTLENGEQQSLITTIIGGSIYIWYFLFSTQFLELAKYHPKLHTVLTGLAASVFLLTFLGLLLPVDYLMSVVIVLGLPWPIVAAIWAVRQRYHSAHFFLIGSTTHCVTTYLLLIACLGVETRSNEYFFALASAGLLFDICCFAVAIVYQNHQLRRQYNRQLQERINDLNSLAESEQVSAKALSMSKQAVLNTAATAHDLQQPLSSMQLMLSMQDQHDPIVKQVKKSLDYARSMLNSALSNSRQDYRNIRETVNSAALLDEAANRHRSDFEAKQITLNVRCAAEEVSCLPLVVNRILDNLLSNACKYTEPNNTVLLSGRKRKNGGFLIQVRDSGQGMSPSQVKKILTPFERINESSESLGFGLGLYIVKSLCNQAGYLFDVSSREGRGSCFSVTVPDAAD